MNKKIQIEIGDFIDRELGDTQSFNELNLRMKSVALEELAKIDLSDGDQISLGNFELPDQGGFVFGIIIRRP